ncbi:universal stress protein [Planctomonas sp. JC2975]|uniref:universal stress protein n=1 Tax=Planctomonas sp. JC2975 TaxID=2729626 RepID=UPI0014750DD4|nr:universal stress protein [Planctomonas sp. JC2975]NNC11165.1 universal stress protein [Planctomonas sp. JC2975]
MTMSDTGEHGNCLVVGVAPSQAAEVIHEAARFASMLGASLVLAAVDPTRYTTGRNQDGTVTAFSVDPDASDVITEHVDPELEERLRSMLAPTRVPWSLRAMAGDPAQELALLADELDAIAIVVGTRKPGLRTTAHEFFSGSVAVHLAHRQRRPVIVVPIAPVSHGQRLPWEI